MNTLALRDMKDAPKAGGRHIVCVTEWDQIWLVVWDAREQKWRHGHGANSLSESDYFKGWLPYHGAEIWTEWTAEAVRLRNNAGPDVKVMP